jgi:hypothetical protein
MVGEGPVLTESPVDAHDVGIVMRRDGEFVGTPHQSTSAAGDRRP